MGFAGVDDGSGHRSDSATSARKISRSETADYLRQRTAVHRPGFQRVHSHRGDDSRANLTRVPTIERKTGALAQIAKIRVHPARHTAEPGRCAALNSQLRGSLQHRSLAQRHRLCDPTRHARWTTDRDSRRTRSQARGSPSPAAAPARSYVDTCTFVSGGYNDLAG